MVSDSLLICPIGSSYLGLGSDTKLEITAPVERLLKLLIIEEIDIDMNMTGVAIEGDQINEIWPLIDQLDCVF